MPYKIPQIHSPSSAFTRVPSQNRSLIITTPKPPLSSVSTRTNYLQKCYGTHPKKIKITSVPQKRPSVIKTAPLTSFTTRSFVPNYSYINDQLNQAFAAKPELAKLDAVRLFWKVIGETCLPFTNPTQAKWDFQNGFVYHK